MTKTMTAMTTMTKPTQRQRSAARITVATAMAGGIDNNQLKLAAKTWWRWRQQFVDDGEDDDNEHDDDDDEDGEHDEEDDEDDEHNDGKHDDNDHDDDVDDDNDDKDDDDDEEQDDSDSNSSQRR